MKIDWQLDAGIDGKNWDLKVGNYQDYRVTGVDELIQRLKIRLWTFLGEWFLDTTIGVPYFQTIFKKGTSYDEISDAIKLVIIKTEEIKKILSFNLSAAEDDSRRLLISFTAQSTLGDLVINNLEVIV